MSEQPILTMTAAASQHLKKMIADHENAIGFRIDVKQTGCTGYMYVPEIINTAKPDDHKVLIGDLQVYLSPKSLTMMKGTEIDYVKKSLGMSQLVFNNPNVDSLCGCGESFNLKDTMKDSVNE